MTVDQPHVLVVDDESAIRSLIAQILVSEGLEVCMAATGPEAVDKARDDAGICLVILDWRMPGMSGEQVLDNLSILRPELKVIVASGDNAHDVERAFVGRKVEQFLRKPFQVESLRTAVKSALAA